MFDISDVIDRTIISIEKQDGRKVIHYYAYSWYAYDSSDTPFRFCEYTGFIVDLEKALKYGISCYEGEFQEEITQYIDDCTEEECKKNYAHYDNGKPPKFISEKDVSMATPYGVYILIDTPKYEEMNKVVRYGDDCDMIIPPHPINLTELDITVFDEVEHELFDVIKRYAEIIGCAIVPDDEGAIDFCNVKEIAEKILESFEDTGVIFE